MLGIIIGIASIIAIVSTIQGTSEQTDAECGGFRQRYGTGIDFMTWSQGRADMDPLDYVLEVPRTPHGDFRF